MALGYMTEGGLAARGKETFLACLAGCGPVKGTHPEDEEEDADEDEDEEVENNSPASEEEEEDYDEEDEEEERAEEESDGRPHRQIPDKETPQSNPSKKAPAMSL